MTVFPRRASAKIKSLTSGSQIGSRPEVGLVEDHEVRVIDHGLSESNASLHALWRIRQRHGVRVWFRPTIFEQLFGAIGAGLLWKVNRLPKKFKVSCEIEDMRLQVRFFRKIPNA
jgi:hypothetical protein